MKPYNEIKLNDEARQSHMKPQSRTLWKPYDPSLRSKPQKP